MGTCYCINIVFGLVFNPTSTCTFREFCHEYLSESLGKQKEKVLPYKNGRMGFFSEHK